MRAPLSCYDCRQSKRKCIRDGIGESCNPCRTRSLACSLKATLQITDTSHEPLGHSGGELSRLQSSEATQSHSSQTLGLTQPKVIDLVELYLGYFHGGTHSIFHPNTLRAEVRSGNIAHGLLAAICALGSRFSSLPDRWELEKRLVAEAKRLVKADLENVCLPNVQACLLLTLLSAGESQSSSEAIFLRVATAMSEVLHLGLVHGSTAAMEASRRVWWSLYLADRLCFSRLGLPRHLDHIDEYPPLPMDEVAFYSLTGDGFMPEVQRSPGIFGYLTLLAQIFGPIQDLNRLIAKGNFNHQQLRQHTYRIGQQLELWKANLPESLQMTVQNLSDHQQNTFGAHFVTLHLVYHHYSTLLYFYCLENRQSRNHEAVDSVLQCQFHASSFSSLLHLSRHMKSCEPNYPITAHMIMVSSSVLLHALLFGAPEKLSKARRDLNMNFEALLELAQFWPATETMIRKLIAFQTVCLKAPLTYNLDGWMVRFLLEQSLGLEESFAIDPSPESDIDTSKLREAGRYTDFQGL